MSAHLRNRIGLLLTAVFVVVGCGDSGGDGSSGMGAGTAAGAGGGAGSTGGTVAGTAGSSAGMGGSSAAGATGGAGGSAAGAEGTGGSTAGSGGGNAGAGGGTGAGVGGSGGSVPPDMVLMQAPGLSAFDLGGFNEDLPLPADGESCLTRPDVLVGCMAVSGDYNGETFDFDCFDAAGPIGVSFVASDKSRRTSCTYDLTSENQLSVAVILGAVLFEAPLPGTFDVEVAPEPSRSSRVSVQAPRQAFTHDGSDVFALGDTHTFEARLVGEAWVGGTWTGDPTTSAVAEFARGVFAASLSPLPSCTPDADGLGCDAVRLRGVFNTRMQNVVSVATEGENCTSPPGRGRCAPGLQCVIPAGEENGTCM